MCAWLCLSSFFLFPYIGGTVFFGDIHSFPQSWVTFSNIGDFGPVRIFMTEHAHVYRSGSSLSSDDIVSQFIR